MRAVGNYYRVQRKIEEETAPKFLAFEGQVARRAELVRAASFLSPAVLVHDALGELATAVTARGLLSPMKDSELRDLLEILEDRYDRSSTVLNSQIPTKRWHELLSEPTVADAICDRLVHNAHVLALQGPSMREKKGTQATKAAAR